MLLEILLGFVLKNIGGLSAEMDEFEEVGLVDQVLLLDCADGGEFGADEDVLEVLLGGDVGQPVAFDFALADHWVGEGVLDLEIVDVDGGGGGRGFRGVGVLGGGDEVQGAGLDERGLHGQLWGWDYY